MGKQEFASGGFTGKVGKFVGQRNGSGLILREWVKTPNPRTETQEANRNVFATCQKLTQFAMLMNKGYGGFDYSGSFEFRARLKVALNNQLFNESIIDRLPFITSRSLFRGSIIPEVISTSSPAFTVPLRKFGTLDDQTLKIGVLYMSLSQKLPKMALGTVELRSGVNYWNIDFSNQIDYQDVDKSIRGEIFGISYDVETLGFNSVVIVNNWVDFS